MNLKATAATLCLLLISDLSFAQPPPHTRIQPAKSVAISAPRPEYALLARRAHLTGAGVFALNVDVQTRIVTSVTILKHTGHAILDAAAMEAFIKWRFKPHTVKTVRTPIRFTMSGAGI